jgi:aminopeptidase YwaD
MSESVGLVLNPGASSRPRAAGLNPEPTLSDLATASAGNPILPGAPPEIQAIINQITPSSFGSHITTLASTIGVRVAGSASNLQAVDYISSFLQDEARLDTTLHQFGPYGPNVVGVLPAGNATNQAVIVVGAHLDSVPGSPGADDDGSGVAAVLEIAHAMAQYRYDYTILFVAFNAEELGLLGSAAYAQMLKSQNVSVAVCYNFDMIMYVDPGAPADEKVDIMHNGGAGQAFAASAASLGQSWLGAPVKAIYNPSTSSDQASFWDQGYPAIWFFENGGFHNPYHHTSQDTDGNPDYSYDQGCMTARTAAAALADFAKIVSTKPGFPTATFVSPSPGAYAVPAAQLPIALSITDSYHDVNRVELSIDGGDWFDASTGLNATHCTYYWNASSAYGPVSVKARVYDAAGWVTSASEDFVVDRGVNCLVLAPSLSEAIPQGDRYTIRVSASDLDGYPLTNVLVRVNASGWNSMTPSGSHEYAYNWTATEPGLAVIQATTTDRNGRSNSSQVTVTVVRYAPVVSDVSWTPLQPTDVDRVRFTALVVQDPRGSGVARVLVFFKVNGEQLWEARLMTKASATEYVGALDAMPAGTNVVFYVQAWDDFGNIVRDDNGGLYYSFTVAISPVRLLVVAGGASVIVAALVGSWLTLRGGRRRPPPG